MAIVPGTLLTLQWPMQGGMMQESATASHEVGMLTAPKIACIEEWGIFKYFVSVVISPSHQIMRPHAIAPTVALSESQVHVKGHSLIFVLFLLTN